MVVERARNIARHGWCIAANNHINHIVEVKVRILLKAYSYSL